MLKEVSYKDLKFNPFRLIGDEWMLVTAGNEKDGCNTMTASNQRDGSFGLCKEGVHIYLASGNQKNRPFGLYGLFFIGIIIHEIFGIVSEIAINIDKITQ